jgi:hypothetical protein
MTVINKLVHVRKKTRAKLILAKLKAINTFNDIHMNKDTVELLKAIKGLTFKFDGEMNLV